MTHKWFQNKHIISKNESGRNCFKIRNFLQSIKKKFRHVHIFVIRVQAAALYTGALLQKRGEVENPVAISWEKSNHFGISNGGIFDFHFVTIL